MSLKDQSEWRRFILDCLSGEMRAWPFGDSRDGMTQFLDLSEEMEVQPILHAMLAGSSVAETWPEEVLKRLKVTNFAQFAGFELRVLEIRKVLAMLKTIGVDPVLLKGIPFSCSIYRQPHHRPSSDTDLLVPVAKLPLIEKKMVELGYDETPDLLFGTVSQQKQFCREARGGVEHVFEFHIKTNNRPLLAPFSYGYFDGRAERMVYQGLEFRAPRRPESLLMAALHRVGHLKEDRRFLWRYDLKLLAHQMEEEDWKLFMAFAEEERCQALVSQELSELFSVTDGEIPREVMDWAERWCHERSERSSYYLESGRTRRSDLIVGIRSLPSLWLQFRAILLLLFPRSSYMRTEYKDEKRSWLFTLYLKRFIRILAN